MDRFNQNLAEIARAFHPSPGEIMLFFLLFILFFSMFFLYFYAQSKKERKGQGEKIPSRAGRFFWSLFGRKGMLK